VIELSPNQMHACTNHGSLCIDVISRHANTEDGNDDVEEWNRSMLHRLHSFSNISVCVHWILAIKDSDIWFPFYKMCWIVGI